MTHIDGLLVGFILCASLAISVFFLKFWSTTRDQIFLAFAVVFAIEGVTRVAQLFAWSPSDTMPIINLVRLIGYLVLIATIVGKNRRPPKQPDNVP